MSGGLVATTVYADAEPPLDEASLPALHQELQWQRNDVRIFAHAAAETQVAIKDALAHKFNTARSGAADSIAAGVNDPGFLEVFPRVASRPPKLLQELEAILVDRLRANDKAASMTVLGSARERDPKLSANLSLDGHRQVMSAFIAGFSTYAPLLSRIQAEFDRALNEGVRSAQENVEMRYQMASNELARERATAEVRGQVLAEDLSFRAAALSKLQELRERAVRAEKKKLLAEKDLRDAQAEEARMRALVESLRGTNNKLQELLIEEDRWAAKPLSGHLVGMPIGPLTKADEEFLEQELGGMDTLAVTPSAAAAGAASAFKSSMSLARNNSAACLKGSYNVITIYTCKPSRFLRPRLEVAHASSWPGHSFAHYWGRPKPWDKLTLRRRLRLLCLAASSFHPASLHVALQFSGVALRPEVAEAASAAGDLQAVQRLVAEGCELSLEAVKLAAACGHLSVLQWIWSGAEPQLRLRSAFGWEAAGSHQAVAEAACAGGQGVVLTWLEAQNVEAVAVPPLAGAAGEAMPPAAAATDFEPRGWGFAGLLNAAACYGQYEIVERLYMQEVERLGMPHLADLLACRLRVAAMCGTQEELAWRYQDLAGIEHVHLGKNLLSDLFACALCALDSHWRAKAEWLVDCWETEFDMDPQLLEEILTLGFFKFKHRAGSTNRIVPEQPDVFERFRVGAARVDLADRGGSWHVHAAAVAVRADNVPLLQAVLEDWSPTAASEAIGSEDFRALLDDAVLSDDPRPVVLFGTSHLLLAAKEGCMRMLEFMFPWFPAIRAHDRHDQQLRGLGERGLPVDVAAVAAGGSVQAVEWAVWAQLQQELTGRHTAPTRGIRRPGLSMSVSTFTTPGHAWHVAATCGNLATAARMLYHAWTYENAGSACRQPAGFLARPRSVRYFNGADGRCRAVNCLRLWASMLDQPAPQPPRYALPRLTAEQWAELVSYLDSPQRRPPQLQPHQLAWARAVQAPDTVVHV
eukprot:XP_001689834.1 predicted protein [Chlamydomonas reinhardtii]